MIIIIKSTISNDIIVDKYLLTLCIVILSSSIWKKHNSRKQYSNKHK